MIQGFENTIELSDDEITRIVPIMVRGLEKKIGVENAVTNTKMIKGLKSLGIEISSVRVRKMIHYIRMTGLIERLVANSKGYYISTNDDEMKNYIKSLHQRAESILEIANQMEFQLKNPKK